MKKIVRLTENDLIRLVKKIINENNNSNIEKKLKPGLLFELGDGSSKVYEYEYDDNSTDLSKSEKTIVARFTTDSGINYKLFIVNNDNFADVAFRDDDGDYDDLTNRGEIFRVMATITKILEEIIMKNTKIKGISYEPSQKDNDKGKGRDNLYRVFIEHAVKKMNKKVEFTKKDDTIFAKFKK